jgi:hypothetical protein
MYIATLCQPIPIENTAIRAAFTALGPSHGHGFSCLPALQAAVMSKRREQELAQPNEYLG